MTSPRLLLLALLLGCGPRSEPPVPGYRVASDAVRDGPFTNRLVTATSPYLRDHAHDPVDWHPWGDEAFEEAKRRDVPVFLSIGYAACHWCHVMHDESFADPVIGAVLNEGFVPIKVDREERPDVDALYLDAVRRLAGDAGWPASLWLTPDGLPFHGGTYFPPEERLGRQGFGDVLAEVSALWTTDRPEVERRAAAIEAGLRGAAVPAAGDFPADAPARATAALSAAWDPEYAGWGRQKFPHVPVLEHLLAYGLSHRDAEALAKVRAALDAMDRGGIHDQIGGGFHRYTVDRAWTTPHFEKMTADNALLLRLYAEAAAATDDPRLAAVAVETAGFLLDAMRLPDGAFATSLDATDSNGEGAFTTWTEDEIRAVLGDETDGFLAVYPPGPPLPDGRSVLQGTASDHPGRAALRAARALRPAPRRDEQRVVAWNALCVSALARAGRLLDRPEQIEAAATTAGLLLAARGSDGALPRTLEPGSPPGVLDDYAFLAEALVDLYEADADPRWLVAADEVFATLRARFGDPEGGLWTTDGPTPPLGLRVQEWSDGAMPSGAGRALVAWRRLYAYGAPSADPDGLDRALHAGGGLLASSPAAAPSLLLVVDGLSRASVQAVVAHGADPSAAAPFAAAFDATWRPHAVLAVVGADDEAALAAFRTVRDKTAGVETARGYVCFDGVCRQPTDDPLAFGAALDAAHVVEDGPSGAIP